MSTALWTGVPLRDVCQRAGVQSNAAFIHTFAADDYSESLPLETAMNGEVLLAYDMNGEALPRKHGAPLRLLVPGRYGMKSTKWLLGVEVLAADRPGYWEQRGWDEAVVVPSDLARLPAVAPLTVGGVAFAGLRGVRAVEVSFDDGATWQPADVRPALAPGTWQLWTAAWTHNTPGTARLRVRAIGGGGVHQVAEFNAGTYPDGATGLHRVEVKVLAPVTSTP